MIANKVAKINENMVYDQIIKFLRQKGYKSDNTKKAYEADIRLFFRLIKDKEKKSEIEFLTIDDVQLTLDDFEDFIDIMMEEGLSHSTINRKVASVKSLIKYLASKDIVNNINYLKLIPHLSRNEESFGVLEVNEVFEMAKLAYQTERELREQKRLLILFALDTCIRKSALLNLKWSNFIERENDVLVQGVDKRNKKFRNIINKDFYEELLSIKSDSQKVFTISKDSINDMMQRLKKIMNIPEERNIKFHSIRKAGVTFKYRITGDILEAQKAANHSSLATTQRYLNYENVGVLGAVSTLGNVDPDAYKKADYDTLIKALEACPKDVKYIVNVNIKKIINNETV